MSIIKLIVTVLFSNSKYKKHEKYFDRLREEDVFIEFRKYK